MVIDVVGGSTPRLLISQVIFTQDIIACRLVFLGGQDAREIVGSMAKVRLMRLFSVHLAGSNIYFPETENAAFPTWM